MIIPFIKLDTSKPQHWVAFTANLCVWGAFIIGMWMIVDSILRHPYQGAALALLIAYVSWGVWWNKQYSKRQ
jgi:hypothetical protein